MKSAKKTPHSLDRLDGWTSLGLAAASLALYARTLVPGLIPGDSAEFQTLAYTLDHAHTTGYEVYTFLAKLFTWLAPVNDVAYRVNLLSAVCAALTVALVYLIGRLVSGSRWAGVSAALTLAVAATFWSQAIIAEVYTMGSLFSSAILLLVLWWHERGSLRALFAAGLLGGLSVGVHGSVLLLAPAVMALLLLNLKELKRAWKPALTGGLAGVLLFVAIFAVVDFRETPASMINSAYKPSITRWDLQPGDLDTFGQRFAFLVFARQWRSAMFVAPSEVVPQNMDTLSRFYGQDFAWPVRLLTLVGLASIFTRRWRLGVFFTAAILVHLVYTLNYRIGDIYVFFISLYVYLAALVAEGLAALLRAAGWLKGSAPRLVQPALALLVIVLALAPFYGPRAEAVQAGELRFDFMDLPPNEELENWHALITYNVQDLPPNAIVLMDWRNLYGHAYAAFVEQGRGDLLFMEAYPYANKDGMADSLLDFLNDSLEEGRPVYSLQELGELLRGGMRYSSVSIGLGRMYQVEQR